MALDYKMTKDSVSNISYLSREVELEEKVWLRGKSVGKAKITVLFQLQTHQKQMQSCVRT
jgi:hypothetical protein